MWKMFSSLMFTFPSVCSMLTERSWQRLDQVEVQQAKFVQWVLMCQDRNSEKFGSSSAAQLNVFFSFLRFSWENQTGKWLLWMITCCVGFWFWEHAALVSSWHLREKNNFTMQMVNKNSEIQNYRYKNWHFPQPLRGIKEAFICWVLLGPHLVRWFTKRFQTTLEKCSDHFL